MYELERLTLELEKACALLASPFNGVPKAALSASTRQETKHAGCDSWNFYKDGQTWHIGQSHFKETKGFFYLKVLIESPGREVDCLELLKITDPQIGDLPLSSNCGEVADRQTKDACLLGLNDNECFEDNDGGAMVNACSHRSPRS